MNVPIGTPSGSTRVPIMTLRRTHRIRLHDTLRRLPVRIVGSRTQRDLQYRALLVALVGQVLAGAAEQDLVHPWGEGGVAVVEIHPQLHRGRGGLDHLHGVYGVPLLADLDTPDEPHEHLRKKERHTCISMQHRTHSTQHTQHTAHSIRRTAHSAQRTVHSAQRTAHTAYTPPPASRAGRSPRGCGTSSRTC